MMHPTRMSGFGKISNIFWLRLCYLIDARSLHTKHVTHWSYTTSDILNNYHFLEFYSQVGNKMRKLWDVVGFGFLFESFLRFRWYIFSISIQYYSIRGKKNPSSGLSFLKLYSKKFLNILCELNHIFFNCINKDDRNFSKKIFDPHFY
jgi:hypothetical protein